MSDVVRPTVSVVIPTYNRGDVIGETLDSVFAQTQPPDEIIVVDDGSTDATEEAIARFRDRIVYLRQANGGLASARNAGMARATSTYVAWLDSDDLYEPEKLAVQVQFMERHSDYVLCATDFSAFDGRGFVEPSYASHYYSLLRRTPGGLAGIFPSRFTFDRTTVYGGRIYERLIDGNCLHPPTVLMRQAAARTAGPLGGEFGGACDVEYLIRMSRLGPMAFIDRPLLRYRLSPQQMSGQENMTAMALSCLRMLDHIGRQDPSLFARTPLRQRIGTWHVAAARALAGSRRGEAIRHLTQSLAAGYVGRDSARALFELLRPRRR
jgi:glycosyltransferase involved in cell wall biosynthesis